MLTIRGFLLFVAQNLRQTAFFRLLVKGNFKA